MPRLLHVMPHSVLTCIHNLVYIRWIGSVARMGEKRYTQLWRKHMKHQDYLEDIDVDKRIILKLTLKIYDVRV